LSAACSLPRHAARVAVCALALTEVAAMFVRASGVDADARELFGFRFDPPARQPADALRVAATNLRFVAAALVAAWAVTSRPRLRLPFDITLALVLALNVGAVGLALGAYRTPALHAVAAHGPFELAAFALAGGAYLAAREGQLPSHKLIQAAVLAVALAALGAVVETYVQIGDAR
jgi:hypothetical protein